MVSGLTFAPIFFLPGLFTLSFLCYKTKTAINWQQATKIGFIFGFGHFLTGLYWVSIAIRVYINEFWWAIPFVLFGLPVILACFIACVCGLSFFAKNNNYYQFIFCLYWVFIEWVRSWIFTGFPWNLLGYTLSFSDTLIQASSIIGVYGLSFLVIYISTSIYCLKYKVLLPQSITSILLIITVSLYGTFRLNNNPTTFSDIKVRLVQPSIPQTSKWNIKEFWYNLDLHIELSEKDNNPDLIIWSETALVVSSSYEPIKKRLLQMLAPSNAILLSGGVSDNGEKNSALQLYNSLSALTADGRKLFDYHKSHLVPFGEYMPLKKLWLLPEITADFLDYTEGKGELVRIDKFNWTIKPLICYESIFPDFVRTSNKVADLIVNVTNDTWYGNSSGPYQHFQISRMRSIENGLPLLRVANNGISAVIDPLGRVIKKLKLNEIGYIDSLVPSKLCFETVYSKFGDITALLEIIMVLIAHILIKTLLKLLSKKY